MKRKTTHKGTTPGGTVKFRCQRVRQDGNELFLFTAPVKAIWEIVEINRRDPNKDQGYQRALSQSRVDAIAKYLMSRRAIPTSLVISFDEATASADGTELAVPRRPDAGWVIDGQHRLAGAHWSGLDIELAVVAFIGLSEEKQIEQFVTINREAKGVPSSLYLDLLKHLPTTKSATEIAKERAADIANNLSRTEGSPFFGRIVVVTSPKRGELSLTNFVRKIYPLVHPKTGTFTSYNASEQQTILSNYYTALENVFPDSFDRADSLFFQTLGFGALVNVLPTVFSLALKHHNGFRVEDAAQILKLVDYFDFEAWRQAGTGNAAELGAAEDLRRGLLDHAPPDEQGRTSALRL